MGDVLERLRGAAPSALAGEPVAFVDRLALRLQVAGALERAIGVGPVEVVVLDEAPLSLAGRIREHGSLFYCVDEILRVRDEVGQLRQIAGRDDADLFAEADALPAAKYRLVVVVEAATDVVDHLIASEGLRPSTSFADSFRSLRG